MTTINEYNFLTYDELFKAVENDSTDNKFKTAGNFLMSAITDWPTSNLQEPKELIAELKKEVNDKLTFDNLNSYLKNLKPNNDAWKMEAIATLLCMFDFEGKHIFDKNLELDKIIELLTNHYRQN